MQTTARWTPKGSRMRRSARPQAGAWPRLPAYQIKSTHTNKMLQFGDRPGQEPRRPRSRPQGSSTRRLRPGQRQYSRTAGRTENCQAGVFLAYASACGQALLDRELYLPRPWADDPDRCREACVPQEIARASRGQPTPTLESGTGLEYRPDVGRRGRLRVLVSPDDGADLPVLHVQVDGQAGVR